MKRLHQRKRCEVKISGKKGKWLARKLGENSTSGKRCNAPDQCKTKQNERTSDCDGKDNNWKNPAKKVHFP